MTLQVLAVIHHMTTLLFGIFISAFFLGVHKTRKNIRILSLLFLCEGLLFLFVYHSTDFSTTNRLYPLLIHLPLIFFLTLYYRYSFLSSCVSTFSAYLFCQISNWIGLLALTITDAEWCYYVARILATILTFVLLSKTVCHTTSALFSKDRRTLCIFGFLPFTYYVFDYVSTKFSDLLYSGNKAIVEFMGFIFCVAYLIFLMIYFREYEQKQEISQYTALMKLQLDALQTEIEQVHISEQKLSILRHDMRHHLNLLLTQLHAGNVEQAIQYIHEINDAYDETVITTYCKNEMINAILSIYQTRFSQKNMYLDCQITLPEQLPCSEIAFCVILSNALENAMHALEHNTATQQWARLSLSKKEQHILCSLENPTCEPPEFADGVPISRKSDHGIGVRSIMYYVEQLHGQCQFSLTDGCFVLRIII